MNISALEGISFENAGLKSILTEILKNIPPRIDTMSGKNAFEGILLYLTDIYPSDKANILSLFEMRKKEAALTGRGGSPVKDASRYLNTGNVVRSEDDDCPTCPGGSAAPKSPSGNHLKPVKIRPKYGVEKKRPPESVFADPVDPEAPPVAQNENKELSEAETVEDVLTFIGYPEFVKEPDDAALELRSILQMHGKNVPANVKKPETLAKYILSIYENPTADPND